MDKLVDYCVYILCALALVGGAFMIAGFALGRPWMLTGAAFPLLLGLTYRNYRQWERRRKQEMAAYYGVRHPSAR